MTDYPSSAIGQTGELHDALGRPLALGYDCDAVVIYVAGQLIRLDAIQRKEFILRFFDAETNAERWAAEHPAVPEP